jgi:methylphosphotriester-DNA--protein-cysteine methyltransferase
MSFLSESDRWNAVTRKEAPADGLFVYGVRTTKIYCQPVCKARLARRANVVFYDTAPEAERANFRACKRCKPGLAGRMPEGRAVQRVRALVEQELPLAGAGAWGQLGPHGAGGLDAMARQAGLSKWHFHRVFKEVTSMTPTEYVRQQSGDSPSHPTGHLRGGWSKLPSYGVISETTVNPELGGASVASTEAGLDVSLAPPLPQQVAGHLVSDPALDNLDFNFDDFVTNLDDHLLTSVDDDFLEELSRIPDEYEPTLPDPWTLASMQDCPVGDVRLFLGDTGWDPGFVTEYVPVDGYTDWP